MPLVLPSGTEEIPPVAGDVAEDGDATVRLGPWRGDELDAGRPQPLVLGVEVVDAHEEADPLGHLPAHDR